MQVTEGAVYMTNYRPKPCCHFYGLYVKIVCVDIRAIDDPWGNLGDKEYASYPHNDDSCYFSPMSTVWLFSCVAEPWQEFEFECSFEFGRSSGLVRHYSHDPKLNENENII